MGNALYAPRAMREDWGTPRTIFDRMHDEFDFTVDGAAHGDNALLPRWFGPDSTIATDGLAVSWANERVWLNPPYGDANLRQWIGKAWREVAFGHCPLVCCFVPVNASSVWWNNFAPLAEIRWHKGRVRFNGAASSAPFASAFLIFHEGDTRAS